MTQTTFHDEGNCTQQQPPVDPWVKSIFQEYLSSEDDAKARRPFEDLVLAALAVLEEDDRLARRTPDNHQEEQQQQLFQQGAAVAGRIAGFITGGPLLG
jgi:hypothetical protein